MMVVNPQVITMLQTNEVQRLINHFKTVEAFKKYLSYQAEKSSPILPLIMSRGMTGSQG